MTELKTQYFGDEELKQISEQVRLTKLTLLSTDSYSDEELWESIKSTGNAELLLCSAIQMCVVGFGNKSYGYFEYEGVKYDVKDLFLKCGVKTDLSLKDKIDPRTLTPRRLQRFFRQQVHEFLLRNKEIKPYLWRKYSIKDDRYRTTTFPGAESLIKDEEALKYLYITYNELDNRLKTKISERILRVIEARGLYIA